MILKGSQRGAASNLSAHLMNDRDNDHVTVLEVRGFVARDLHGAFAEAHAISKGTKCEQFLFSLSLSPPKDHTGSEQDFVDAINRAEEKLKLSGQPRAIVLHEKEGRRHAHVVWSRIDAKTMKAINLPHYKLKLNDLARQIYLDHGWSLPDGLRRDGGKSPLNFTLAEWQQAKRVNLDPREIKQSFIDAWNLSDSAKGLQNALEERGYFLCRGDRRGFVAVDTKGEVFSVARMLGIKTKEVNARLGDPQDLYSVDQTRDIIQSKLSDTLHCYIDEVDRKHEKDFEPLKTKRSAMVANHRIERAQLKRGQAQRWQAETEERSARIDGGIKGVWQKLSGSAAKIKSQNELEAWDALKRDQSQRDGLVKVQMKERQSLQRQIDTLRRKHAQDRRILARDIAQSMRTADQMERMRDVERSKTRTRETGLRL
ncbi:relaxase/mobilization nuclease domain-containing protein [Hoeflea sp. G2-23]|uniref:Relaxase/mobilization nuclease domain-containing protein n=1 Tax=Hoeflea algicola TaxID=2983763 RepID=A0ABT3ZC46_9HYPH|nr:relaxase/mobilization nuclease domain-containing protein [Hoeflea algicola]MCY0149350.1 relaxase/mobilization nuclease domain-containing protein [Hoeflea algicola]